MSKFPSVSNQLINTHSAFYSRHLKLRPIQKKCIQPVLSGKNIVVCSNTASGKTKAVMAPLTERCIREKWHDFSILYVVPTRALVNDVYFRMEPILEQLNISISRKTSDHPTEFRRQNSQMLITTPESFESLLVRSAQIFQRLKAIVLDEIHLLDNTPRGDQLRLLIERVRRIKRRTDDENIQICALSATLPHPIEVGKRYMDDPVEIVDSESKRKIIPKLIEIDKDDLQVGFDKLLQLIKETGAKKVLTFCNSKKKCEKYSKLLDRDIFHENVRVHHGDLPKETREQVEEDMNQSQSPLICFATMTLEIGIDIGNIDLVVLIEPPKDQSAFLQRIGRGCRRRIDNTIMIICCYFDEYQKTLFQAYIENEDPKYLCDKNYVPKLSVLYQQSLCFLSQKRDKKRKKADFLELFERGLDVSESTSLELLDHLFNSDVLRNTEDIISPGNNFKDPRERSFLLMNFNPSTEDAASFVDVDTGETVSTIARSKIESRHVRTGGRDFRIKSTDKNKIYGKFVRSSQTFKSATLSKGANQNISFECAQLVKKQIAGEGDTNQLYLLDKDIYFHFLGSVFSKLMTIIARSRGERNFKSNAYRFFYSGRPIELFSGLNHPEIKNAILKKYAFFLRVLELGKYHSKIPNHLIQRSCLDMIDIDSFNKIVSSFEIVRFPENRITKAKKVLLCFV